MGGDKLQFFARDETEEEGKSIANVIKDVKPHILIGLSGVGGIFTTEILTEMGNSCEKPIIFALSNPTSRSECTAE